jgi:phosphatidylserine/phosphatidylglycerophosphate/cardiolipin synthase-like enzyme
MRQPHLSKEPAMPSVRFAAAALSAVTAVALAVMPGVASADEPDPVIDHATFNNPVGNVAEQNAIFSQFARLIDRVPAGEQIALSFFGFDTVSQADGPDTPDLTARLIAAHDRGVNVKVILDQAQVGNEAHTELLAELGDDDSRPSWIVTCADQFPDGPDRGCIGTRVKEWSNGPLYAYNHNKFALFSALAMNNGSTVSNVVFTGSSNIGVWDANEAFNNMLTISDAATYRTFTAYFEDLRAFRYSAEGDNDYYTDSGTGSTYRTFFFPRHERAGKPFEDPGSDTIYNTLQSVDPACKYQEADGSWHQTDVRVAMLSFNRPAIAKKLASLSKAGCWVDVVYSDANAAVLDAMRVSGGPQLTRCYLNVEPGRDIRVHSKYMLIDGGFADDITPRVYTGSHNYAWSALRQSDETLMRITGRPWHDEYLNNFHTVRDTCAGKAAD